MARLGDYVRIRTGKLDANASSENGQYPFFTCAVEPLKIDAYSYDCECVLVAGNGGGDRQIAEARDRFGATFKALRIGKLVKTRREGKAIYYSLDDDHVKTIIEMGKEHSEE
jgi:type I restriction enzyme S subunit